ncbi:MAG: catalase [Terriglobia bacterium]|nr:MAG: catalase [Terriglobia bacterium]
MPTETTTPTEKQAAPLITRARLRGLAATGLIILSVVTAFLYLGGWFAPGALTPARFVDGLERAGGMHSGFRRNHAKGVAVSGFFESNGQGMRLSKALIFRTGRIPVIGRFSLSGAAPSVADAPDTVRGLGLLFRLPDGEEWRTAMVNLPVFPVKGPQGFYDLTLASAPDPQTHKPDPQKMEAFLARHPETARAFKIFQSHPPSSGFENSTFNSLMAFRFVNASGVWIPVRWSMVPVQPFAAATPAAAAPGNKNYLFDALIVSIHRHPLQWHLMITIGQPGDVTNDANIPWPVGREQVDAGTLTLDSVESEETSPARDINFDPAVLPAGIEPSDDLLLSARSAVYSESFRRRAGETKESSAITPSEVRQ